MTESDLFLFLFVLKFDFKSLNCFAAIGIRIDLQPSNHDSYVLPGLNTKQPSPIHSTSLEMSEVSSETDMLLISVPQQPDAAIFGLGFKDSEEVVIYFSFAPIVLVEYGIVANSKTMSEH